MRKNHNWIFACSLILCCMSVTTAYGKDQTKVKGLITGRTSDTLALQAIDGTNHVVILNDATKVQVPKGLGLRKKQVPRTELIPGLRVEVKGDTDSEGKIVASSVNFNNNDLTTAKMIQAGLRPTQQQVQENQQNIATNKQDISANKQATGANTQAIDANKTTIETNKKEVDQRFSELADYDVKGNAVVHFKIGSTTLSQQDRDTLSQLVNSAKNTPGYIIQVQGYADSTGSLPTNQTLSRDRAEAVIQYLMQECNVPPRHVLAPKAMGISHPAASNQTASGRAENRRVDVRVLVNKGIGG